MVTVHSILIAAGLAVAADAASKQVEVYMYRAASSASTYAWQNVDLADLPGVLKYVHTETLAEHSQTPERKSRKYGIAKIERARVFMRNPDLIVNKNEPPMTNTDFSEFVTFDSGQATNTDTLKRLAQLGDAVGIQEQTANRNYKLPMPYYWFSLSGFCPNLPYQCTDGWTGVGSDGGACTHEPPVHTQLCTIESPCPSKGSGSEPREDEAEQKTCVAGELCPPTLPGKSCVKFTSTPNNWIMGGLCSPPSTGGHPETIETPTGERGCTYSYDQMEQIDVDDLVGFGEEKCAEDQPCTSWLDFRENCADAKYKRAFDKDSKKIVVTTFCVEYDIHPDCALDCTSELCAAVTEQELGLPFWHGRCDAHKNLARTEKMAIMFKIPDAENHVLTLPVSPGVENGPCDRFDDVDGGTKACRPNSRTLGPFCTRVWGGVCTVCYIPGGTEEFSDHTRPTCPLNMMNSDSEYASLAELSKCKDGSCCKSTDAKDECCLYFDSCSVKLADIEAKIDDGSAALDASTFALAAATGKTAVVQKFIMKYALAQTDLMFTQELLDSQTAAIADIAKYSWNENPATTAEAGLAALYSRLDKDLEHPTPAPTPTPTAAPTPPTPAPTAATPAPAGQTPAPTKAEESTDSGGMSPIVIVLIIVGVLAAGGGAYYFFAGGGGGGGGARQADGGYELRSRP